MTEGEMDMKGYDEGIKITVLDLKGRSRNRDEGDGRRGRYACCSRDGMSGRWNRGK